MGSFFDYSEVLKDRHKIEDDTALTHLYADTMSRPIDVTMHSKLSILFDYKPKVDVIKLEIMVYGSGKGAEVESFRPLALGIETETGLKILPEAPAYYEHTGGPATVPINIDGLDISGFRWVKVGFREIGDGEYYYYGDGGTMSDDERGEISSLSFSLSTE